jgi:thiamine-monophosphate kinase
VPPAQETALTAAAASAGIAVTRIGRFRTGRPEVTVRGPSGTALALGSGGWSHF